MSQTISTFSAEDVKQHKLLSDLISQNIDKWSLNTTEVVQLYRSLVWFAQLEPKLEKSIMEVISVKPAALKKQPGKKATRDAQAAMAGS